MWLFLHLLLQMCNIYFYKIVYKKESYKRSIQIIYLSTTRTQHTKYIVLYPGLYLQMPCGVLLNIVSVLTFLTKEHGGFYWVTDLHCCLLVEIHHFNTNS